MNTVHNQAGELAARNGAIRAAPQNLKIITQPWKDWYAGYDAATTDGANLKLDSNFSKRKA